MPATVAAIRCEVCQNDYPRLEMSIIPAMCSSCFTTQGAAFCDECGVGLVRPGYRGIDIGTYRDASGHTRLNTGYAHAGDVLCHRCFNAIQTNHRGEHTDWPPTPLNTSFATYDRIGSKRKFGVEIETDRCDDWPQLYKRTPFGSKGDCTVSGMEFDSPVLYGDEGLAEIEDFLLFGEEHNWATDDRCGCHTHYDVRDESYANLVSIAYAYRRTMTFWQGCVPARRRGDSYCHDTRADMHSMRTAAENNDNFSDFLNATNAQRYDCVNLTAWWDHKTFEVRSLEGTCDSKTICNWVIANCRFMDAVRTLSLGEVKTLVGRTRQSYFDAIANIIHDADIVDWLRLRASENGRPVT